MRLSTFLRLGQDELNQYQNDQPVVFDETFGIYEEAEPIGVTRISRNKIQRSFFNLEPRISLAYSLNNNQSVKMSYNRMSQNLHLITNTSSRY